MRYHTALFDLDGTLTDSAPGIMNSIRYALKKHGMTVPSEEVLRTFIGPPLKEQFQKVFSVSEEEAQELVKTYREYFSEKGLFENSVYAGVPEMLSRLRDGGVRVMMATSKPEKFAKRIAEQFGLTQYFEFIGGASMSEERRKKDEVIEYVLASCGIPDEGRSGTVMVGDRFHDIEGAEKTGLHSLGVLYGYGSREELEGAGAEQTAATPGEAADRILGRDR